MVEILLIAVSLALDAFAVSVSSGISVPGFGWKHAVKMGCYFGFFQFAMPLIGWLLGTGVSTYIGAVDHWVAFVLLALIGGKMVWEALKKARGQGGEDDAPTELTAKRLTVLAVATSIDALAVGVSMAFMAVNIVAAAVIIGVVAFLLTIVGGLLGRRLGSLFQQRAELVGGFVLIGIGVKILCEHLM
ncbi:MAG: manganese efflux pump [Clostridia bacterium]|nr:manganese efflux pump [Clostridia bacterium]